MFSCFIAGVEVLEADVAPAALDFVIDEGSKLLAS